MLCVLHMYQCPFQYKFRVFSSGVHICVDQVIVTHSRVMECTFFVCLKPWLFMFENRLQLDLVCFLGKASYVKLNMKVAL